MKEREDQKAVWDTPWGYNMSPFSLAPNSAQQEPAAVHARAVWSLRPRSVSVQYLFFSLSGDLARLTAQCQLRDIGRGSSVPGAVRAMRV